MSYFINNKNLTDFGITVNKFHGWELPADKTGSLVFDNAGFDGVEYLENEVKAPRTLILKCTLKGSNQVEVDQFFSDLQDWLYMPGNLELRVDYLSQTFNTFFVDGISSKKITRLSYSFDLKLRQYDFN